jgi:uncharacterized delta-60 repeat protein
MAAAGSRDDCRDARRPVAATQRKAGLVEETDMPIAFEKRATDFSFYTMPYSRSAIGNRSSLDNERLRRRDQGVAAKLFAATLACGPLAAAAVEGSFDPTWAGGGRIVFPGDPTASIVGSGGLQILVQPDGKLLLGGFADSNVGGYWWLGQLFANGNPVPTFGESNGSGLATSCWLSPNLCSEFGLYFAGMALQSDGRIVAMGSQTLARMSAQAHALDTAGVSGGTGYISTHGIQIDDAKGSFQDAYALTQLISGKWLLAGEGTYTQLSSSQDFAVIRLNADMSLDTTFNAATDGEMVTFAGGQIVPFDLGGSNSDLATSMLVQGDGRIVLMGFAQTSGGSIPALARLNADGSIDQTFGGGTGKATLAWSAGELQGPFAYPGVAKLDRNGRIVIAMTGIATGQTNPGMAVVRLFSDGTPDAFFGAQGVSFNSPANCEQGSEAYALAFDSAGRILVAGVCLHSGGATELLLERLTGNDEGISPWALDTTFGFNGFSHGAFAAASSIDYAYDVAFDSSGHPVFIGTTFPSMEEVGVGRVVYDLIYTNNFETAPRGCLPPNCN